MTSNIYSSILFQLILNWLRWQPIQMVAVNGSLHWYFSKRLCAKDINGCERKDQPYLLMVDVSKNSKRITFSCTNTERYCFSDRRMRIIRDSSIAFVTFSHSSIAWINYSNYNFISMPNINQSRNNFPYDMHHFKYLSRFSITHRINQN